MRLRSLATAARLGRGALMWAWRRPPVGEAGLRLISFDVFGTLLHRLADENAAARAGAWRAAALIRAAGRRAPADPWAYRRRIEAELSARALAEGRDPEFSHRRVLLTMLERAGVPDAADRAEDLAAWELACETRLTAPVPDLVARAAQAAGAGRRVVAISDTRYEAPDLAAMLAAHGVAGLGAVYASADHGASKFSGRLFDRVCAAEAVVPGDVRHTGDSLTADILSGAQRGLRVRRVRPPPPPPAAAPLPAAPPCEGAASGGFGFGYETMGPILTAFCRLVLARAELDDADHLAFVARDGDLPLRICEILLAGRADGPAPRLSYLHLSRRAVKAALAEGGEAADRLRRYLEQAGALDPRTALVDVGWAGSTRRLVVAAADGRPTPRAYYLGLFDETGPADPDPRVSGLLCDQRLSRGPLEGAAWQAAFLIEAVCRGQHGTVLGWEDADEGTVRPRHASSGAARAGELFSEAAQGEIRAGVLAYARWFAATCDLAPPDMDAVRRAAQRRLFALAFFPTPLERAVGRDLVHTEAEGAEGAITLSAASGRGLRSWLAGIRSPWKGAYFRETTGPVGAALYCAAETALGVLPPGVKPRLSRLMFGGEAS